MLLNLYLIAAGVILCAGVVAAAAALAERGREEYGVFALLCLPSTAFVVFTHALYTAGTIEQAAFALRWQAAMIAVSSPLFVAFIALFTGRQRISGVVTIAILVFATTAALSLAQPYGLRFSALEKITPLALPWGEVLPRFRGTFDPWGQFLARITTGAVMGWGLWRCFVAFRAGRTRRAGFLLACLLTYIGGAVHGFLVDSGRIDAPYLTPLAFFTFVLLLAASLALDLRDARRALHHRATHDPVTGLANRAWLEERLRVVIAESQRDGRGAALVTVNLDHFKLVNATYGHEIADRFLRLVGERIARCLPSGCDVACLGADEFAILLAGEANAPMAELAARGVAEAVAAALHPPFAIDDRELRASASLGIVPIPAGQFEVGDVLRMAGVAMIDAKARGRSRSSVFAASMEDTTRRRVDLDRGLREAIDTGTLELRYQPQFDAAGAMIGAEALVRWRHPERGDIPPAEFIPIAEQTGLVHALGEWVRRTAFEQVRPGEGQFPAGWRIAINVSPWELVRTSFPERVERLMAELRVEPRCVMFELTEGVMLHRLEVVVESMARLRALGVRFSIDDFGTGYSSLAYLRELPLDQLKIDKVFVRGLEQEGNRALIRSIADIGNAMGLEVIAEGVETEEQRSSLFALGCHAVQGYLLGMPLEQAEFRRQVGSGRLKGAVAIFPPARLSSRK